MACRTKYIILKWHFIVLARFTELWIYYST
nr:MAG TPA: hypothetical protein [Caudoviricetes sp.]